MSNAKHTLNDVLEGIKNRDNPLCYQDIRLMIEEHGFTPTDPMIMSCNPDDPDTMRTWISEQL